MEALGRLYNLACIIAPVDIAGGAVTGNRVHLKDYSSVDFVFFKEAGAASEATTLDVQQHNVASSGTPLDLDVVEYYYLQSETTLDADETWTKVAVSPTASEVTPAVSDTQQILVIHIDAAQLADGYEWVSVNTTDTTTAGQLGCVLAILNEPGVQRSPANLAQPNA